VSWALRKFKWKWCRWTLRRASPIVEINGESYYDWVMLGGAVEVKKAPADSWKTPINFETHEQYFGPGIDQEGGAAKEEMYITLKDAVLAKA